MSEAHPSAAEQVPAASDTKPEEQSAERRAVLRQVRKELDPLLNLQAKVRAAGIF